MADAPAADDTAAPEEEDLVPEPELVHGAPVVWSRGQKVLHPAREPESVQVCSRAPAHAARWMACSAQD